MLNKIIISSGGEHSKNIIEEGHFREEAPRYLNNNIIAKTLINLSSHSFTLIDQSWKTTVWVRFQTTQLRLQAQRLQPWNIKVKTHDFRLNTYIGKVCPDTQAHNWWISPYEIVAIVASIYVKSTSTQAPRTATTSN